MDTLKKEVTELSRIVFLGMPPENVGLSSDQKKKIVGPVFYICIQTIHPIPVALTIQEQIF